MPRTDEEKDIGNRRGPIAPALVGQLLGLALALVLYWLHSGGDFSAFGSLIDVGYPVVLGTWLLSLVLTVFYVPRRATSRPHLALWLSMIPALAGAGAACLYAGLLPRAPGDAGNCDLVLANAFWAERLKFVGLLASGSMWWGVLITLLFATTRPTDQESEKEYRRWPWVVAALMLAASAVWIFLDPAMPSRAKVGGPDVRGLWVLVAGVVVLWVWARQMTVLIEPPHRTPALWSALSACLGLFMVGLAMIAYHRFSVFFQLAHSSIRFQAGVSDYSGAVAATALLRLAPSLLAASVMVLVLGFLRFSRGDRRRTLALLVLLVAGSGLYLGHEAGWRSQYSEQCEALIPAELELPETTSTQVPEAGSLLVVDRDNAWLDGHHVIEATALELNPLAKAKVDRGDTLNLAVDQRVDFARLGGFLRAAGKKGWHRFQLLTRLPSDDGCRRERRVFGVCLSGLFSSLGAIGFEIPHFAGRTVNPVPAPQGVIANVIVEPDGMEVSFGGFQVPGEVLDSLAAKIPDRLGVRNLAELLQVLTRAKERFPASSRMILVAHDDLQVGDFVKLIAAIYAENPDLFSDLVVSRLMR